MMYHTVQFPSFVHPTAGRYRPTVEVAMVQEALGFDEDEADECAQFLLASGCFLDASGATIDPKQSRITEVSAADAGGAEAAPRQGVTDALL